MSFGNRYLKHRIFEIRWILYRKISMHISISKAIWHLWTIRWCHCSEVFPTFKLHLSIKRPIRKFYTIIRVFRNTKSRIMYSEKSEICHENNGRNSQSKFQLGAADVSRSTGNNSSFFFFIIFSLLVYWTFERLIIIVDRYV